MTQQFEPGLGSGALREALEKHEYMNGSCLCREFRLPPYGKKELDEWALVRGDWMRDIRWKYWLEHVLAALSLSSPIEPPACSCNDSSNEHGCPIHGEFYASNMGAQASSEVRERLERWLKLSEGLPCTSQVWDLTKNPAVLSSLHPDCACTGCIFRREIAEALAPSRQGAGGK